MEDDLIPMAKLKHNLSLLGDTESPIVLLSTGSYCPAHTMHIEIFDIARAALESQQRRVVAGFLSPSHDSYVGAKMRRSGSGSISAAHRLQVLALLLADSAWLSAAAWEASQPRFVDFPAVCAHFQAALDAALPGRGVEVWYVCGSDHCERTGLRHTALRVVSVARRDEDTPSPPRHAQHAAPTVHVGRADATFIAVTAPHAGSHSSTAVRRCIRAGDRSGVAALCGDAVAEYIEQHKIAV